ncbi:hypothetical protein JTB14_006252 [Gonioctena quinquepunctata]|nr:hypothetical protein JTB14_006252 [Gonioctena quinquepunctata]
MGFSEKENIIPSGKQSLALVLDTGVPCSNTISTNIQTTSEDESFNVQERDQTPNPERFTSNSIMASSTPTLVPVDLLKYSEIHRDKQLCNSSTSGDRVYSVENEPHMSDLYPHEISDKFFSISEVTFTDITNLVEGINISELFPSILNQGLSVNTDESIISGSNKSEDPSGHSNVIPLQEVIHFHESNETNISSTNHFEIPPSASASPKDAWGSKKHQI